MVTESARTCMMVEVRLVADDGKTNKLFNILYIGFLVKKFDFYSDFQTWYQ